MGRLILPGPRRLSAGRLSGPLVVLALTGCLWLPTATASGSAALTTRSSGSLDHCLLGSWRLRAAKGSEDTVGDLVGITMRVTLGHGLADGAPFEVMAVNLAGSAFSKTYGTTLRGTQSVAITVPLGRGSYGVVRLIADHVVAMEGSKAEPSGGYVLGTLGIYTCTSSQIHIRFFDNGDLSSATFARL